MNEPECAAGAPSAAWESYEIVVMNHLDDRWSIWFEGMKVSNLGYGLAALSGSVRDQAALHGILARIRDLNLKLVSVNRIESARRAEKNTEVEP
jgi:hypothetical protein